MDRNQLIGFSLLFLLFLGYVYLSMPSPEEIAEQQRVQDSLEQVRIQDSIELARIATATTDAYDSGAAATDSTTTSSGADSLAGVRAQVEYGDFAAASRGKAREVILQNDLFKITFSTKGGSVKSVELLQHEYFTNDSLGNETTANVVLMNDERNRFEYLLPAQRAAKGTISTADLYFTPILNGNTLTMRAEAGGGAVVQQYTIQDGSYTIDYTLDLQNLGNALAANTDEVQLNWVNYLNRLERNTSYEAQYSTVYYKPAEESVDNCSCTSDDIEKVDEEPLKWVSHAQQFFNSTLIAEQTFGRAVLQTETLTETSEALKLLRAEVQVPVGTTQKMQWYIGPNEFDRLQAFEADVEDIIPFGSSIFGTINRWLVRPLFNFLLGFVGSAGISIILLTVLVRLAMYPLNFRMLKSQAKMQVLKPEIAKLKEKVGTDDPTALQMETMKLYRETGVNPLGGCLPMVLQMPIWFALYRFFPASIEFRQRGFLWADDLSTYDIFTYLPFEIPFYGTHVSLFTLLWAGTTVLYTFYNTRHMDMSAQPAMKYIQYFMPLMFLFMFNNFAAGLTCYLLFSNVTNIIQTLVTKEVILDKKALAKELQQNKLKPKKKKGFGARLEEAMKEQQRKQQQAKK